MRGARERSQGVDVGGTLYDVAEARDLGAFSGNIPIDQSLGFYNTYARFTPAATTPVPEPASLTLLGLGLAGVGARRWRLGRGSRNS